MTSCSEIQCRVSVANHLSRREIVRSFHFADRVPFDFNAVRRCAYCARAFLRRLEVENVLSEQTATSTMPRPNPTWSPVTALRLDGPSKRGDRKLVPLDQYEVAEGVALTNSLVCCCPMVLSLVPRMKTRWKTSRRPLCLDAMDIQDY